MSRSNDKKHKKMSDRKCRRKIRGAKALFRAIDVLFERPQNSCPYVNKNNIDTIECSNDIVYDETLKDVCTMDVYRCKSDSKQPAILLIHGGGFTAGDKKYRKGRAQFFALNGFTVFCVNYGLAPDFKFPEPLVHIINAANFIYDRADEFNIDADRIFADGDSAGGYYAAMLAAFNGNDRMKDIFGCSPKFEFCGALLNCGVYDLDIVLKTNFPLKLEEGVILSLTGISLHDFDNYEYKDACAPIGFVTEHFPPTFIIYSDYDLFCKGQGNAMVDKLKKAGVYCEYYSARRPLSNHCFSLTWRGQDATAANEYMLAFAKRLAAGKINL